MSKTAVPLGIIAEGLSLEYDRKIIFNNLSFQISAGKFTGLLGASGIGKTSLLRIIAGLIKPHKGTVLGTDGNSLDRKIAYMGQQDLLFPWLSVLDNVCLGSKLRHETKDIDKAMHLLDRVGLQDAAHELPHALSGGMRQRTAIARTLYEDRPVVLMDEPFSALDAVTRANIQELAIDLLQTKTVLLITHDPAEAARLCHQILLLKNQPAKLLDPIIVEGIPPRNFDDNNRIKTETQLMNLLKEG